MANNVAREIVGEVPPGVIGYEIFVGATDADSVVCLATYAKGRVVFNSGRPGHTFHSIRDLKLGNQGTSVAYTGTINDQHHVVWNDSVLGTYEWVGRLYLSSDGEAVAYPTMETTQGQNYRLSVNGRLGRTFEGIGQVIWHPQKREVAYVAEYDLSQRIVWGDEMFPRFERVGGLQFSPQGNLYYWGRREGNWWLCDLNGTIHCSEGEKPPAFGLLHFGPNENLGFWFCKRGKWHVRYGREEYGPYPGFQQIVGGPRVLERCLTYVSEDHDKVRVYKNEVAGQEFDAVGMQVSQPNIFAYKARAGREEFLMVNESKGKSYPVIWPEERENATYLEDVPVISANGDKVAFIAANGEEEMVVVNEREGPTYKTINGQLTISPGTNRLVYGAQNGHEKFVTIDSNEIGPFEEVTSARKPSGLRLWGWCPEFLNNGESLRFFCVERGTILKCTVKL